MGPETICRCRNLSKSFGRTSVLKNCNLEITRGRLIGLVGENGSGKTTLVRCLLGYLNADAGTIELRGPIGYCPQEVIMNRVFTVREYLAFIRSIYNKHCAVDDEYIAYLLEIFRLTDYLDRVIGKLSGGTRQKVQFITSILHQPSLLLMDEPYEGFDWEMYLSFWDIVDDLREAGTGVLLITHFVYDHKHFDHIYNLKNGSIHEDS